MPTGDAQAAALLAALPRLAHVALTSGCALSAALACSPLVQRAVSGALGTDGAHGGYKEVFSPSVLAGRLIAHQLNDGRSVSPYGHVVPALRVLADLGLPWLPPAERRGARRAVAAAAAAASMTTLGWPARSSRKAEMTVAAMKALEAVGEEGDAGATTVQASDCSASSRPPGSERSSVRHDSSPTSVRTRDTDSRPCVHFPHPLADCPRPSGTCSRNSEGPHFT